MANIFTFLNNTRLVYFLWWLVWATLFTLVLHHIGYDWRISITDSIISNVVLGLFCLAIGNIIMFYQPSKHNAWKLILWCLFSALMWNLLTQWLLTLVFKDRPLYLAELDMSRPIRFAIGFLGLGTTVLAVWIVEFIAYEKEQALRQAAEVSSIKDAELAGLSQKLQPHFIFNSLNSINALIGSSPAEARKMIEHLSDFLRGTLRKDEKKMLSFREELNHLKLYLDIEKVRFGHRLSTDYQIEEECYEFLLPPLILQPIVENAIKFGLYDTTENLCIELKARNHNGMLSIEIRNPFDPQTTTKPKGAGFGLKAVYRRLELIYLRADLLKTDREENIFITRLNFPQQK